MFVKSSLVFVKKRFVFYIDIFCVSNFYSCIIINVPPLEYTHKSFLATSEKAKYAVSKVNFNPRDMMT